MAVYIRPCVGCPLREGCDLRADFRRKVHGLGLRSATFNCSILEAELRPGRRIIVLQPIAVYVGCDAYEGEQRDIVRVEVPATILSAKADVFSCVVDREALLKETEALNHAEEIDKIDTFRFRKAMRVARIVRFLDEPDANLCKAGRPTWPHLNGCDRRPEEVCYCSLNEPGFNQAAIAEV